LHYPVNGDTAVIRITTELGADHTSLREAVIWLPASNILVVGVNIAKSASDVWKGRERKAVVLFDTEKVS